jgi:hypothetical protein
MDHQQYGGVPKRFKGSVLKTDSGVMLQLEFESPRLRQMKASRTLSVGQGSAFFSPHFFSLPKGIVLSHPVFWSNFREDVK